VVAVHLGGRRDQHPLAEEVAVLEHDLGALEVRHEGVHGLLDDQAHPHRRCEVVDDVAAVDELVDDRAVEHGVDDEVELVAIAQMLHVRERPGGEVVERPDLPACGEQQLGEMGADEAGSARDQRLHGRETNRSSIRASVRSGASSASGRGASSP
jgi:hypothetical protein